MDGPLAFRTLHTPRDTRETVRAIALSLALALIACGNAAPSLSASRRPELLRVRVIRSFPHDSAAFTQGLLVHDGMVYESTGLFGRSSIRRVDLTTGQVLAQTPLDPVYFGEGLARVNQNLYQLTWTNGVLFIRDLNTLQAIGERTYQGQGWGLCFDGTRLVMSDGSDRLAFRDPATFEIVSEIHARDEGQVVAQLNELECVGSTIYANIWGTDRIARIDAGTGEVTGWIDAAGLLTPQEAQGTDVLNGIAHLPGTNRFLITGKLWPRMFEVEFVPVRTRRRLVR